MCHYDKNLMLRYPRGQTSTHTAFEEIHTSDPLLNMSMHLHKSRWMPTSHPSTFSWLDNVEQLGSTSLTNDGLHYRTLGRASSDQDSTTSTLHSCLKLLDQHCDRLNNTYKEILEIRTHIAEILASSQSEVAMGNVGAWDSSVDQSSAQYASLSQPSVGVISTLPEGTGPPVHQFSQEPLLPGASSSVSHELGTQSSLPEDDTCSEEQTLSGPLVRRHQRLYLPVVQDGEDKVKCMWSGCSSVIKKDSYTRHVSEVHKRRFKAVCTTCRKEFLRPYMKKTHICPRRFSKRSSS